MMNEIDIRQKRLKGLPTSEDAMTLFNHPQMTSQFLVTLILIQATNWCSKYTFEVALHCKGVVHKSSVVEREEGVKDFVTILL